ncbi:transcriptional regulator with XRE-family HTH domain [Sporomusaceae bacterium BoRhaA]|uniref:helix-turn-helix domain-containing protein n=1 Tax=Pelorhabdus rhamnosifermentans TaxID=2772457 RepID=UPI001C0610B0|nr:helix-turn-helix transcriptional regulator [Pelorhabdus rhamnosifermentans]MBU2700422.1 transcriptional regulator with XRE-family HTH domain [Pelorhabdus rhamnosifermentans]
MEKQQTKLRNIRKLKSKELGLSVKDIAGFLGISIQHYYALERGERRLNADQINSISKLLGISSNDILGAIENNNEILSNLQDTTLFVFVKKFVFNKLKETANNMLWSHSEVEKYITDLELEDKNKQIEFLLAIIKNITIVDGEPIIEMESPSNLEILRTTKLTVDEVIEIVKGFPPNKRKAILKKLIDIS